MDSLYYVYIHVLLLLPNTDRFRGCNWQLKKAKTIYKILNFIFVVLERGDSSLECFNQTTVYSSRAPEFIPVFSGVCVAWFLVFYVVFCRSWFFFSFGHCIVCLLITPLISSNFSSLLQVVAVWEKNDSCLFLVLQGGIMKEKCMFHDCLKNGLHVCLSFFSNSYIFVC